MTVPKQSRLQSTTGRDVTLGEFDLAGHATVWATKSSQVSRAKASEFRSPAAYISTPPEWPVWSVLSDQLRRVPPLTSVDGYREVAEETVLFCAQLGVIPIAHAVATPKSDRRFASLR